MSKKSPPAKSPAKPAGADAQLSEKQLDQAAGGMMMPEGGGTPYIPRKRP